MAGRFIHIAVGVLVNARGEVLICQRPPHKLYPGEWEFPGGKVEANESCEQALARELHEELGIRVTTAQPLIRLRHRYPELAVDLDTWRVTGFDGEVRSSEHPAIAWVPPMELPGWRLLAADRPIVNALRLPPHLVVTPPATPAAELRSGLARLPRHALLRLRQPALDDVAYAAVARTLAGGGALRGPVLIVDRSPEEVEACGAGGWHANARVLLQLDRRPVASTLWFGASCHDELELAKAAALGADYVLLGPVLATPTHAGSALLGWERFETLARGAGLPVYAIGGVGPSHLEQARARGAHGVAGISAYWRDSSSGGASGSESAGIE